MRKLLLLLFALLTGVSGAWAVDYTSIRLTFSRVDSGSGTATNAISDVSVAVTDQAGSSIAGVTASLVGMISSDGSITQLKTGTATALSRTSNAVLAPHNGYGNNQNSTIEYTFRIQGLSTDFNYKFAALDVYALTSGGENQGNTGGANARTWSFDVQTGSTEGSVTSFVSQANNDICTIDADNKDGGLYYKNWFMTASTARNATADLYIKVILTRTASDGCYAGLGSVTLSTDWESRPGWKLASSGHGNFYWIGVHTPGDASKLYSFNKMQMRFRKDGDSDAMDNYLAIARVSATSTLDAKQVIAVSDNHLRASANNSLETFTFDDDVVLLGGKTYYLVFVSSNTPTDGQYTVRQCRLTLNHTDYGTYPYGNSGGNKYWIYFKATLDPVNSITSLPTANNKAYVIKNARGTWNFADDATSMSAAGPANTDLYNEQQHIALIYKNSNYYLFSVNAGKYLTSSNTLTSMPTDAEQVDIVATGDATYPWFFRFKDVNGSGKYTKNINVSEGNLLIDGWGPNGSNGSGTLDEGNRNIVIEAADFDATDALNMFNTRNVTYNLSYGGNTTFRTVADITVSVAGDASEFMPVSFDNDFVTFSYSPATIAAETTEVTVTATWNGPFQITATYDAETAKWYTIGIHKYYEGNNYIWTYNGTDNVIPQAVATNSYSDVTNERLFCFVGNPYDGFTIYNKAAGSSKKLYRSDGNAQVTMNATATIWLPKASSVGLVANGYFCLQPTGENYINFVNLDPAKLGGWNDAGNGSTCWATAPSQYPYNFLNGYALNAPNGAVGTPNVDAATWTNAGSSKTYLAANPFYYAVDGNRTILKPILDALDGASLITLGAGYHRIVSAVSRLKNTAAMYYNPSVDATHIVWSTDATTTDHKINSIFKLAESADKWTIYSPNAHQYISNASAEFQAQTATIGDAGDITINSIGSAQYTFKVDGQSQCIAAKNSMKESSYLTSDPVNSGTLNCYNFNDPGHSSAWYIVPVSSLDIDLNSGSDGYYYATLCLPFAVSITDAYTKAYTLTLNGDKDGLTLSDAITDIVAGTPVLLRGTMNKTTLSLASDAPVAAAPLTSTALTGVYVNTAVIGDTDYFLGLAGDPEKMGFYHWAGTTLKANRAYFDASKLSLSVKGFTLDFDNLEDGIQTIDNGQLTIDNAAIYNLAGQRVQKAQKGLYIVNGKKVVIK